MSCYYVASAKKSTVVRHAITGAFTAPDDLNLILGKTNRLELFTVTAEGLKPICEINLFGRIATLNVFRPKNEKVDSIVVVTTKYHMAVLTWDAGKNEFRTRASGHMGDRVGRPSETGMITCVHESGLIVLRIYDGQLKVIEWEDGKDLKAFCVRVEDCLMCDIQFISPSQPGEGPRLSYICEDSRGRHLKTVELLIGERDVKTVCNQGNIESAATTIIPIPAPFGGCVILGQETILYTKEDKTYLSVSPPLFDRSQFTCFTFVDEKGSRILIGDLNGNLYMLLLDTSIENGAAVRDIKMEFLGEISIPECLVYLDNGVVFVGSSFGDSQLIRLTSQPNENNLFITVLETFPNIGPIRDLCVIESDGLSHIVTCSGAFKEGSLRIIRNGIGIEELASVDLPGVKGLFPLRIDSLFDNFLVVSLSHETHILRIVGEELEDTQLNGLQTEESTLWCGGTIDGAVLQVTKSEMRLAKGDMATIEWRPPRDIPPISLVSVNSLHGQVVLGAGVHLFYFQIANNELQLVKRMEMNEEMSCLNVSQRESNSPSQLVAVALWREMSTVILSLPDLIERHREPLGTDIVPRAIELVKMEETLFLLVSMGDGTLYYFVVNEDGRLRDGKKVRLGTQPTSLHTFNSIEGKRSIFACSDRPAVLYSSGGKLTFSNVNLKLVTQMCYLNSQTYRNSIVISDGETLVIGRIDDIQKLHIRTISLGESVSRIAHQPETGTMAILTYREDNSRRTSCSRLAAITSTSRSAASSSKGDMGNETHSIVIVDENTFEFLHAHELKVNEHALSIHSTAFGQDRYYIVGTAFIYGEEPEAKTGRLLVFEVKKGERGDMRLIHERETKGAVHCIATLANKLVVAINSSVRLFEWSPDKELKLECSHFNYTTALFIKTKGDILLVGDLMRSLCLLNYRPMESVLEECARDYCGQWMTACEIVDTESFIGAEAGYNIFSLERETTTTAGAEERQRLNEKGAYFLGELLNVFRRGSLISSACQEAAIIPYSHPIVYGTADGGIGVMTKMNASFHKFLLDVESSVAEHTSNCMRVDHASYRSLTNERVTIPKTGFVDGDLVEGLLDMPREEAIEIVRGVCPPGESHPNSEEVLKLIEELSRLH